MLAAVFLSGCYSTEITNIQGGIDTLRMSIDTLRVRDSLRGRAIEETRRVVEEERDLLMGTRAATGTTSREIFETLTRLEAKVDDLAGRFERVSSRVPAAGSSPATPGGAPARITAEALYDQAALDLTQGRYPLALSEFRQFTQQFPQHELADNARFGAGESFFAQGHFDSAAVEYGAVGRDYPQGDKVPAALYKLALSYERLGEKSKMRETFEGLIKRFPNSGEAQLARERLGQTKRR